MFRFLCVTHIKGINPTARATNIHGVQTWNNANSILLMGTAHKPKRESRGNR